MNRKDRRVIHIGTVSMVLIFAVLALVTFALLSWSSAQVQWKLAEKLAQRTDSYYEAETQAVLWLEQAVLSETGQEMLSRQIPVGEHQQLEIQIRIEHSEKGTGWKLERWLLTERDAEQQEETFSLYGGELPED